MSAYVVSKEHVDLLVRAALEYGRRGGERAFRWWNPDEDGNFDEWRELDPHIDGESDDRRSPSQLGQILVDENVRSVYNRYPDTIPDEGDLPGPIDAYYMGPYVYDDPRVVLTPAELYKAIDCLDYQSCESDDWRHTEAFLVLEALRECACRCTDGYEDAPWGWDADDVAARLAARA